MTDRQWEKLRNIVTGKETAKGTTGFIIDSPWLPGWNNLTKLQYYTSDGLWFQTNKKALESFPDIFFLPGFWSEYGMCTEPSAFGAKLSWHEDSLPWAAKHCFLPAGQPAAPRCAGLRHTGNCGQRNGENDAGNKRSLRHHLVMRRGYASDEKRKNNKL